NGGSGGCHYTCQFYWAGCVNMVNTKWHMALTKKQQELKHTYCCAGIKRKSRGPGAVHLASLHAGIKLAFMYHWRKTADFHCIGIMHHQPMCPQSTLNCWWMTTKKHCTTGVGGSYIWSQFGHYMSKQNVAFVGEGTLHENPKGLHARWGGQSLEVHTQN
ncbi:hypothetical protein G9A89_000365, partial [Geosiphon pyriformis]